MSSILDRDPGPVSWQVGQVLITRVEEVTHLLPIDHFLWVAPEEVWRPHRSWIGDAQLDDAGTMSIAIAAFVVESRGRRIVVDTCIGPEHANGDRNSPFMSRLAAAGFLPNSVDAVICTHFHFDHVGWNTRVIAGERCPTFERATYFFGVDEWNATHDDPDNMLLQSVEHDIRWVAGAGLAELLGAGHAITDEVSVIATFGHSPGHLSVLVRSDGAEAIITGDAAHHPLQLVLPEIATTADFDPAAGADSRRALIDRALDRDVLLIGTHFAPPCAGYLRSGEHRMHIAPAPVAS